MRWLGVFFFVFILFVNNTWIHIGNEPNFATKQCFLNLCLINFVQGKICSALEQEYCSPVSSDLLVILATGDILYYLIATYPVSPKWQDNISLSRSYNTIKLVALLPSSVYIQVYIFHIGQCSCFFSFVEFKMDSLNLNWILPVILHSTFTALTTLCNHTHCMLLQQVLPPACTPQESVAHLPHGGGSIQIWGMVFCSLKRVVWPGGRWLNSI